MKRTMLLLLAAGAVTCAVPAMAQPQDWMNINQRQNQLDQRIDVGVRNGQLTASEAARLRAEFQDIARIEERYRRDGLSDFERADLDRRFDQLSIQIRSDRADGQRTDGYRTDGQRGDGYRGDGYRGEERRARWENLNQRQAQFQQRLDTAVRDGRVTYRQARILRAEFRAIANLEQRYRRGGLSYRERADLDRRFDRLQANFRASVRSSQYGYGYGQAPNLFDYLLGVR